MNVLSNILLSYHSGVWFVSKGKEENLFLDARELLLVMRITVTILKLEP